MRWKLELNTTWHRPGVFIADFDPSQYINIVFRLLTWNKYLSEGCERATYLFCNKSCKAYFIQRFTKQLKCTLNVGSFFVVVVVMVVEKKTLAKTP